MNDEFGKKFCDVLKIFMWSAGVLVRQFELGREGYLPELISKEGREAIEISRKEAIERDNPKKKVQKKKFPMGFA